AGEHSQKIRVFDRHSDKSIVRKDARIQELEGTVLRSLDSYDVSMQPLQCRAQFTSRLTKYPPIVAVTSSPVLISFWLYPVQDPLVNLWKSISHCFFGKSKQIDDHYTAGSVSEVFSIAIRANVLIQSENSTQAEPCCLFWRDYESGTM